MCLIYQKWLIKELIDTLWNVNLVYKGNISKDYNELIDTLWNVNNVNTYAKIYFAGN